MDTQSTFTASNLPIEHSGLDTALSVRHPPIELIRSIITAPGAHRISVVITGAAIDLISDLIRIPGASSKFISGQVPYHQTQVSQLMGYTPSQSVSKETAIGLAQSAFFSAQKSAVINKEFESPTPPNVIGLGLTGAIATSRERKGDDHIWVAIRTAKGIEVGHFNFEKGSGEDTRAWQNEMAEFIALHALASKLCISEKLAQLSESKDSVLNQQSFKLSTVDIGLRDFSKPTLILPDGSLGDIEMMNSNNMIIYPGSFRSFHCGHDLAAESASRISGKKVVFEISATNADKAAIDGTELARRAAQFLGRHPVIITPNAPLFIDKSLAYPKGTAFATGFDTAERLLDLKYYKNETELADALNLFRDRGNVFYVLGRKSNGLFKTILDLPGYEKNRDLFVQLTGQLDISATALQNV